MGYNDYMSRKIKFAPGAYYHIYNRGIEKRNIFLNKDDYRRFLILLYLCNDTKPVNIRDIYEDKGLTFGEIMKVERKNILIDIGVYCLMPNHIHFLITPRQENSASRFMQKLFTAYTMYFNKKDKRTGRLFESTFKAKLIDKDEYFKYLFAYIHLNPIKLIEPLWQEKGIKNRNKAKDFLNNYSWSSYQFYTNRKQKDPIINIEAFPKYFLNLKEFNDFIESWLESPKSPKV